MKPLIYRSILPLTCIILLLIAIKEALAQIVTPQTERLTTFQHLFGTDDWRLMLIGAFYLNVGIFFSSVLSTTNREPNSDRTPFRFSWKFFAKDNWKRWVKSVLWGIVAMRFSQEIFNQQLTVHLAFMIGLGIDAVIILMNNKKVI